MTGVKAIADALSVSSCMTFLDLSSNELTGKKWNGSQWISARDMTSIKAIADALSVSSSMKKIKVHEYELPIDVLKTGVEVDLSGRNLRVEDAIIIAACINVNSSMKSLKYVIPPLFFSNLVGTGFPLERS